MQNSGNPVQTSLPVRRFHAGRWVVVGLFLFAIVLTGTLWFYWKRHIAPYLPLQQALAKKFPGCKPRVEGGQRKIQKSTPKILRITMKVEFDPTKHKKRINLFADRVAAFVGGEIDLQAYNSLELHFYWPDPEKKIHEKTLEIDVAKLLAKK